MKIIDGYILAVFTRFFIMAVGLLVTLFVLILFFELIGDFVRYKASFDLILRYFLFKTPEALYYMAPMAVLGAATLTLSLMSKDRETLALMSSGVSAFRIASPILAGALFVSLLAFLDSEFLMPQSFKKADEIHRRQVKKIQDVSLLRQNGYWIKTANEDMWNIGYLDVAHSVLYDVNLIRFSGDMGGFKQIISAGKVYRAKVAGWTFENGTERTFDPAGGVTESSFQKKDYDLSLEFAELKQAEKTPQEMNFSEITGYIRHIKTAGYDDIRYSVDRYVKITFPLISLVMAFMALPFGFGTGGRASGALPGITFTASMGFVFWFVFSMCVSMGHSGKLSPLVAASGAHLLFLSVAVYLMLSGSRSR